METLLSEPLRKNVFEAYYILFEQLKIKNIGQTEKLTAISNHEKIVLLIERSLQQKNIDKKITKKNLRLINNEVSEFLSDWLNLIQLANHDSKILLECIAYKFTPVINIIHNITSYEDIDWKAYLKKISPPLDLRRKINQFNAEKYRYSINPVVAHSNTRELYTMHYLSHDDVYIHIENYIVNKLLIDYKDNIYKINKYDTYVNGDIEDLWEYIKSINLNRSLESLFILSEDTETAVWDINLTLFGNNHKAADVGYLLWSLATALESLGDVEVELTSWRDGSKKANLKVTIKSNASKMDVKSILDKARQLFEAFYFNKPTGEIEETEARALKIRKEIEIIPSISQARTQIDLDIEEKLLKLKMMELEIESKKIENVKKISELILSGLIKNDNDIQISINDLLYLEKKENNIIKGSEIRLIEANEQIDKTSDSIEKND